MKMTILPLAVVNYRWIDPAVVNYRCTPTQQKKKERKTQAVVNYHGVSRLFFNYYDCSVDKRLYIYKIE